MEQTVSDSWAAVHRWPQYRTQAPIPGANIISIFLSTIADPATNQELTLTLHFVLIQIPSLTLVSEIDQFLLIDGGTIFFRYFVRIPILHGEIHQLLRTFCW